MSGSFCDAEAAACVFSRCNETGKMLNMILRWEDYDTWVKAGTSDIASFLHKICNIYETKFRASHPDTNGYVYKQQQQQRIVI